MTTTATPIPDRLEALKDLTVYPGGHEESSQDKPEGCANELISWVCGLPWSESPPCTDERLSRLIVAINDGIADDDVRSRHMRKVIPLAINTADREGEVTDLLKRLAIRRLKEECLPLADQWPESVRAEVVAAIEQTIAAHEGKGDSTAAESAAESAAWSAAESAAESAAWSAARSAAESAAWSAAESAAWSASEREAVRLIAELEALPAPGSAE